MTDREKPDLIINDKVYRFLRRSKTYWVSEDGEVLGGRSKKRLPEKIDEDGYCCIYSQRKHRLVALAWVDGWFPKAEVHHIDFNRLNNHASNLRWVTHKENVQLSVKENSEVWNKSKQGIHNGRATFTEAEVIQIRNLYDSGMSVADILKIDHPELQTSKQYKSLHSTYLNICKRKTWKHIA